MGIDEGAEGLPKGRRGAQLVARERSRRRRPNIAGAKRTVEVVMSEAEYAEVKAAAAEAGMTVPWYLVQAAVNPVAPSRTPGGKLTAWLPWPRRQTLASILMSAAGAMDEVRRRELAPAGSNLNQITKGMHISGGLAEEIHDTMEDLRELYNRLLEDSEEMMKLAREVARR